MIEVGQQRLLTVEKVGNRWLTLSNDYRVDKDTLEVDGGSYSSPGRCWLSQQEYEDAVAVRTAWNSLGEQMRVFQPAGLTLEKIEEARRVLGMGINSGEMK